MKRKCVRGVVAQEKLLTGNPWSQFTTNYVKETDEEARHRSNRTYRRILASLAPEVAARYGHVQDARSEMESELRAAMDAKDWATVTELSNRLAQDPPSAAQDPPNAA